MPLGILKANNIPTDEPQSPQMTSTLGQMTLARPAPSTIKLVSNKCPNAVGSAAAFFGLIEAIPPEKAREGAG